MRPKMCIRDSNNSSRSPRDYMAKLEKMGCPITRDQIMTLSLIHI